MALLCVVVLGCFVDKINTLFVIVDPMLTILRLRAAFNYIGILFLFWYLRVL